MIVILNKGDEKSRTDSAGPIAMGSATYGYQNGCLPR